MPGTSTEQVVDKGIRQKSTKEWTHSLTAVPFVRGHRSVFPRTPRNTGVYTRHPKFVTATSGVLTRLPAKLQQNRSWIKGLGKNPQKSELIHWRQCLLSGGTEACSLGLREETPACIHVIQSLSQPRVACWHSFRQNSQKRNACLHAVRQAVKKRFACIYGLRSEGVKGV